jgi:glycerol-3-phosphate dehydrogenase subunit B
LGDARSVGFPAVLGLAGCADVHAAFEAGLGVPVFEIPTMPTSAPGLRLQAALETTVAARGVQRIRRADVHWCCGACSRMRRGARLPICSSLRASRCSC